MELYCCWKTIFCDKGEVVVVILPVVLAECVFVLDSFYEKPRSDIAAILAKLISSPGVEISDIQVHLDALSRYGRTKIHFVDCLVAATAVSSGLAVATFDRDFRKFTDITVDLD